MGCSTPTCVQAQCMPLPSLVLIIVTGIALFLATNGPTDWRRTWHDFCNPPPDARHAIRRPNPNYSAPASPQIGNQFQRAHLLNYVAEVERSLAESVRDQQRRLQMLERIYMGIPLSGADKSKIAQLLEGISLGSAKSIFIRLQNYADAELASRDRVLHAKFIERSAKFTDELLQLQRTRDGF